jgi:hypothetical protein
VCVFVCARVRVCVCVCVCVCARARVRAGGCVGGHVGVGVCRLYKILPLFLNMS